MTNTYRLYLPPIVLQVRSMDDYCGGVYVEKKRKATYHSLDYNGVGIKSKRQARSGGFVRGRENLIVTLHARLSRT